MLPQPPSQLHGPSPKRTLDARLCSVACTWPGVYRGCVGALASLQLWREARLCQAPPCHQSEGSQGVIAHRHSPLCVLGEVSPSLPGSEVPSCSKCYSSFYKGRDGLRTFLGPWLLCPPAQKAGYPVTVDSVYAVLTVRVPGQQGRVTQWAASLSNELGSYLDVFTIFLQINLSSTVLLQRCCSFSLAW